MAQPSSLPGPSAPPGSTRHAGAIYDLGYRGYSGPRLGRRHAVWALFVYSFRACFGLGRPARAKIVPLGLAVLSALPALVALAITAIAHRAGFGGQASPIRYDNYYGFVTGNVMLFCAAQAPELLGRDQRYQVLPLYFSRALVRSDYALAKLAALLAAILVIVLLPQALIFLGLVLSGTDIVGALPDNLAALPPILGEGVAIATLLGSIGVVIAAFTPRRAYATAAIMALFIVSAAIAALITSIVRSEAAHYLVLLSPGDVLDGANSWFFGREPDSDAVLRAALPGEIYLIATVAIVAAATLITLRRYGRIAT